MNCEKNNSCGRTRGDAGRDGRCFQQFGPQLLLDEPIGVAESKLECEIATAEPGLKAGDPERSTHSPRKTVAGSIDATRRAGMRDAATLIVTNSAGPSENDRASSADVPKSRLVISPLSRLAATMPSAMPASVTKTPSRRTSLTSAPRVAPSAARTPSSRRRCDTL